MVVIARQLGQNYLSNVVQGRNHQQVDQGLAMRVESEGWPVLMLWSFYADSEYKVSKTLSAVCCVWGQKSHIWACDH